MNLITNDPEKVATALAALKNVYDPEIGLNVVDLGLIYEIDFFDNRNELFVSMTLTTQFCPMGESIRDNVIQTLQQTFPGYSVEVDVTFYPPWSQENISEEGLKFLNG